MSLGNTALDMGEDIVTYEGRGKGHRYRELLLRLPPKPVRDVRAAGTALGRAMEGAL